LRQFLRVASGAKKNPFEQALRKRFSCEIMAGKDRRNMKFKERIEQMGATGYILLWLLGIPIPILFLFFLLRGCT
jgi:hypothetical protein